MHLPPNASPGRSRVAVGSAFFLSGLCFSSWASRIPTIQQKLGLSESLLGSLLFALPLGSILSSFFSASIATRFGTRRVLTVAMLTNGVVYISLGLARTPLMLASTLFVIGCLGNITSVALNTQAVGLEKIMNRPIMASLHGLWSAAGFVGAAIGGMMLALAVPPVWHFAAVYLLLLLGIGVNQQWFLHSQKATQTRPKLLVRPPAGLLGLGLIAFCSMICEGAMFDWSGVYFQRVLQAGPATVGLGYGAVMGAMATSRFLADPVTGRLGPRKVLTACGLLVMTGLLLAIAYPTILTGVAGFVLVGIGTSAVVPLVYSQAGKTEHTSPSAAIAATSTIGFLGFLLGPPMIGWIAGVSSLRWSFLVIAMMGLGITLMGRRYSDH